MAEAAAAGNNEQRQRNVLAGVLLTCFSAPAAACRKQVQLASDEDDDAEVIRRRSSSSSSRRPSTAVDEKPLRKIADAFKELANVVSSSSSSYGSSDVDVAAFSRACSFVGTLFGCLGFHFKFIEMDYVTKVNDIAEASKSFRTLQAMVDQDVRTNSVRKQGSHSRNLLKIKRGLDFLRVLFEQIVITEGNSVRDVFSRSYTQIFHSYHGWALRRAVSARLHYIPTKQQIFRKLNEDESAGKVLMQTYVLASPPVLRYVENIFLERGLGIDW